MEQLTSIHESLQQASMESEQKPLKTATTSFKCEEDVIKLAHQICRSNGTNLSSYLRQCCKSLVEDYIK